MERCLQLTERALTPCARHTFEPGHFTASAFVLSPDRTRLLLIFHGKLHRWLQPGGHIDPDDASPMDAALREAREETDAQGLSLAHEGIFDVDIHRIPALKDDPSHEHFDLRYLFVASKTAAVAGSDARDVRWCPLDQVSPLESDESVMRAVRKLRRRLDREGA
ncbi:MAG: NUDIX hydrolase [Nannocystaceae bacterium]